VRMSENCQKPAFSVANTGSSGTPVQTSRPCGRWVVGVFQGRLITHGDRAADVTQFPVAHQIRPQAPVVVTC
ncbi:hypothetical protein VB152_19805, partial [Xanthomonas fragariae]|nr:hypothetical protein [Xanthomonas fragariae]